MKKWMGLLALPLLLMACSSQPEKPLETQREIAAVNTDHAQGKKLFYGKCASCHMVNKEMTGPALKGVEARWPDQAKLYAFIRNSEEIIRSDKYARELWLQYNQTAMPPHPDLTDADIRMILDYVNSVSQ
jgi:mono/diheme cytochrome c family protein